MSRRSSLSESIESNEDDDSNASDDDYNLADAADREERQRRIKYIAKWLVVEAKLEPQSICKDYAEKLYVNGWTKIDEYTSILFKPDFVTPGHICSIQRASSATRGYITVKSKKKRRVENNRCVPPPPGNPPDGHPDTPQNPVSVSPQPTIASPPSGGPPGPPDTPQNTVGVSPRPAPKNRMNAAWSELFQKSKSRNVPRFQRGIDCSEPKLLSKKIDGKPSNYCSWCLQPMKCQGVGGPWLQHVDACKRKHPKGPPARPTQQAGIKVFASPSPKEYSEQVAAQRRYDA